MINTYYDSVAWSLFSIPMWWLLMFMVAYFMRRVLTQFFVMQNEAEQTRDSLTLVLENLPDAVLMLEADHLSYCNQQADSFFGVSLSTLNDQLLFSEIMNKRCMYETEKVVQETEG